MPVKELVRSQNLPEGSVVIGRAVVRRVKLAEISAKPIGKGQPLLHAGRGDTSR